MNKILEVKNIGKVYPGVVANEDISFSLYPGEIHAICGENGAGKTTLMQILFGMIQPSSGTIYFKGNEVVINNPEKAISMGIGMVHQHFMLVPSFTVAQNLVLGKEPSSKLKINQKDAIRETEKIAGQYNLNVTPTALVSDISVAMMQKLEILKALYRGAKILILDEPTAVLTPQETDELFKELLAFKEKGHTIIFISHKLKEVKQISDRVTIIRKGKLIATEETSKLSEEDISELMIGKLIKQSEVGDFKKFGDKILDVSNLSYTDKKTKREVLKNISFNVSEGEILGVAGVEGNGQEELVQLLTGRAKPTDGNITFKGENTNNKNIKSLRKNGLSFIPEDRMKDGCAKVASIWENLTINRLDNPKYQKFHGIMDLPKIYSISDKLIEDYQIKCSSNKEVIGSLSGGNIQKVVVARENSTNPKLLIANQPTRGVDVGAARIIHNKIIKLKDSKSGILLLSADLTELLKVCTSLIVIFDGEIMGWFKDIKNLDEKELGLYMLGLKRRSHDE
jgi:simple sugar transport system ATP-binding protein